MRGFLQTVALPAFDYKTFYQVLEGRSIDLICPTAAMRPYMPFDGEEANVWFNRSPTVFRRGTLDEYEDVTGTQQSIDKILDHLTSTGARYKHVIIGGLSMGGGLALYFLGQSNLPENISGIFSMGSFLIEGTSMFQPPRAGSFVNNRIPVLMLHGVALCSQCVFQSCNIVVVIIGEDDSMIHPVWGAQTGSFLTLRGFDVCYKTYPDVGHEIGVDEVTNVNVYCG